GVDSLTDRLHGRDFERRFVTSRLVGFQPPQAVFSRNRAVVTGHDIVHDLRSFRPAGDEGGDVFAHAGDHVIVKIAVADVAEDRHAATRMELLDRRRGLVDEIRDSRYGNRDVVFPAAAFGLERRRVLFAQTPELGFLSVVLGDGGVDDQTFLQGGGQQALHRRLGAV